MSGWPVRTKVTFPKDLQSWQQVEPVLKDLLLPSKSLDEAAKKLCKLHSAKLRKTKTLALKKTPYEGLENYFRAYADVDEASNFVSSTLPNIAKLALELRNKVFYLSEQQVKECVSLGRKFVAGIVATAFLCLFPDETVVTHRLISTSSVNFDTFYERIHEPAQRAKLRCILNYFNRLVLANNKLPGFITFRRVVIRQEISISSLLSSTKSLCPLVVLHKGLIEDAGSNVLQVDFANKCIGGGVLGLGNCSEEIRFSICPELLTSILFMERLAPNEAIIMQGFEQFSQYRGFGNTFKFAGDYIDQSSRDEQGSLLTAIAAIDAVPYRSTDARQQYLEEYVAKDINKAYAGYSQTYVTPYKRQVSKKIREDNVAANQDFHWIFEMDPDGVRPIATGNWGCGAFGGDVQLKTLLQWIAASYADCPAMIYYTYENASLLYLADIARLIGQRCGTVGELTKVVQTVCTAMFHGEPQSADQEMTIFSELWKTLDPDYARQSQESQQVEHPHRESQHESESWRNSLPRLGESRV